MPSDVKTIRNKRNRNKVQGHKSCLKLIERRNCCDEMWCTWIRGSYNLTTRLLTDTCSFQRLQAVDEMREKLTQREGIKMGQKVICWCCYTNRKWGVQESVRGNGQYEWRIRCPILTSKTKVFVTGKHGDQMDITIYS